MPRKSKREARIERKNLKLLSRSAKAARLGENLATENRKEVRAGADPNSIYHLQMSWTIEAADRDGEWSWGQARKWTTEDWERLIEPKLLQWERLTWKEIDNLTTATGHKMHHSMDCIDICSEAQERMNEIELVLDIVFRFRLGSKPRLWGFRQLGNFHILWFDPFHKIYPLDI